MDAGEPAGGAGAKLEEGCLDPGGAGEYLFERTGGALPLRCACGAGAGEYLFVAGAVGAA